MQDHNFELEERSCIGYKCGLKFKVLKTSKIKFCSTRCKVNTEGNKKEIARHRMRCMLGGEQNVGK